MAHSPRITELYWGRLRVEGMPQPLRDAMLYPGGARSWDWGRTGTRHRPGIGMADVAELLARGARVIVLSRGMLGLLATMPEVLTALAREGIPAYRLRTVAAVRLYNELARTTPVGGLIHSSC
ncbi:MAG: MTH938/NDUFAF3 family protein [Gemmatimonadaceae bacterium]